MDGVVQAAEAGHSIVSSIRTLHDSQEFHFAGPYRNDAFLEDYAAQVHGETAGNVVLGSASWSTTGPGALCCSWPD